SVFARASVCRISGAIPATGIVAAEVNNWRRLMSGRMAMDALLCCPQGGLASRYFCPCRPHPLLGRPPCRGSRLVRAPALVLMHLARWQAQQNESREIIRALL